jgi:transcription antitermination factor NusG
LVPWISLCGFAKSPRFDIIREADGVAGVLGVDGAPLAVRPEVLQQVADEIAGFKRTIAAPFVTGQRVSVQRGPFAELTGLIEETGNGLARVMVEMFGKKHPVELDFVNLKVA